MGGNDVIDIKAVGPQGNRSPRALRPSLAYSTLSLLMAGLVGCVSPAMVGSSVMAYDSAANGILSEQLLVNIARARHHQPTHFTAITNIAATSEYRHSLAVGPALTGQNGGPLVPLIGTGVSEKPIVSLVPIEGAEFTRRLLMPIPDTQLALLLGHGENVGLVLRMLAEDFRPSDRGEGPPYLNRPHSRGYPLFRRIVLHLASVQQRNALRVQPLVFEQHWTMPVAALSAQGFRSLENEFSVDYERQRGLYHLSKSITGRTIITNYDTTTLANDDRVRLNAEADHLSANEVMVDIRPDHAGGEYPTRGMFRLRSFQNVLNFLGRGIAEEPEYPVEQDQRTPLDAKNPVHTLEIMESDQAPPNAMLVVPHDGRYYAVKKDAGMSWNSEAFRLLYQLFQMTVSEIPRVSDSVPVTPR